MPGAEQWDRGAVSLGPRTAGLRTWVAGARCAGVQVPDLPNLTAAEARLSRGAARKPCGSGVNLAAVATDGSIFPCYRCVFGTDYRLGNVVGATSGTDSTSRRGCKLAGELLAQQSVLRDE